jgi:ribonuclease P protein component
VRNRARRRLKDVARRVIGPHAAPGDYVMVARDATATRDFSALLGDAETALRKLGAWRAAAPAGGAE